MASQNSELPDHITAIDIHSTIIKQVVLKPFDSVHNFSEKKNLNEGDRLPLAEEQACFQTTRKALHILKVTFWSVIDLSLPICYF